MMVSVRHVAVRRFAGAAATTGKSGNDPYGGRDFGAFTHNGDRIFRKIDSYDRTEAAGAVRGRGLARRPDPPMPHHVAAFP